MGHQALADLRWWARLTREALLGRALWPAPDDAVMHTDASLTGWGATWNKTVPARGLHAPARRHLHINVLELATVRLGLLSFVGHLREGATMVRIMMDSLVSVHEINNGTSKSEAMMAELRLLKRFCAQHGVQVRASHLPSAVNYEADRLSRSTDSTDWSLSDVAFRRLEAKYGPHTLDLFATSATRKCGRYFSATADPGTAGVNAFAHPWGNENCWCNPPFQLLGSVVAEIIRRRAAVTLIAPVWRAQGWWHRAVEACDAYEVLPRAEGGFTYGAQDLPAPPAQCEVRRSASAADAQFRTPPSAVATVL